ncbi:MAG: site-specific integrase, partial [Algicola sp.]|nr:site-specific integrase [Algicola sp.]
MSLSAFISYLGLEKNYSKHTILAYQKDIEAFSDFCAEHHGEVDILEVSYPLIRNWIVELSDQGISNRSINRKISSLQAYYKFLLKIGDIAVSPLVKHRALKTEKKVEVPFSENEMESILSEIPFEGDFEGERDKLIIELLYATGMR